MIFGVKLESEMALTVCSIIADANMSVHQGCGRNRILNGEHVVRLYDVDGGQGTKDRLEEVQMGCELLFEPAISEVAKLRWVVRSCISDAQRV